MPRWNPSQIWKGEDAYIIGGGDSLRKFDWDLIRGQHTIGCNSAFLLGAEIVEICIFGDRLWWEEIGHTGTDDPAVLAKHTGQALHLAKSGTQAFGGLVVGCSPRLMDNDCPWLLTMKRHNVNGMGLQDLGWNGNTGAMAINLALILGARRVFLLGYDMKLGQSGNPNWHELRYQPGDDHVYAGFRQNFVHVARDLKALFPGREVINVTDDSQLEVFPKVSLKDHFTT